MHKKVHRSCLNFLHLKNIFINAFTENSKTDMMFGAGQYVGYTALHTDQYYADKIIILKSIEWKDVKLKLQKMSIKWWCW